MATTWSKTQAGRQEIQVRSKVAARAQRTLLLLIDGKRGHGELLAAVRGTTAADFEALAALGLIVAVESLAPPPPALPRNGQVAAGAPSLSSLLRTAMSPPIVAPETAAALLNRSAFTSTLTELITLELGMRGFALTQEVERVRSPDEMRALAERVIAAITQRHGAARGNAARRALYGDPPR